MPSFVFDFRDRQNYTYDDKLISILDGGLVTLRLHHPVTLQYTWGDDAVYESSDIDTFDFTGTGIVGFWGAQLVADIPTGTAVKFQVSIDKGTSWLRWDGSNWVNDGQYSDILELNEGLPNLSFVPAFGRTIRFKIRLETDVEQKKTPLVFAFILYYNVRYNYFEDIARSIKRYIENNLECRFDLGFAVSVSGNVHQVETDYIFKEVEAAYRLSTDSNKVRNILQSIALLAANKVELTLTESLAAGEFLLVDYLGRPEVRIAAPDAMFINVEKPHLLVYIGRTVPVDRFNHYNDIYEYNVFRQVYRHSLQPELLSSLVSLIYVDKSEKTALQVMSALYNIFDYGSGIPSVALYFPYVTVSSSNVVIDDIVEEALRVKRLNLTVLGYDFTQEDEVYETNALQEVVLSVGDFKRKLAEVSIT